jgi:hypothetical protein
MADTAEYGLMLWDGKSKGTINNVVNMSRHGKPVIVYVAPTKQFLTVKVLDDLKDVLAQGDSDSVDRLVSELQLHDLQRRRAVSLEADLWRFFPSPPHCNSKDLQQHCEHRDSVAVITPHKRLAFIGSAGREGGVRRDLRGTFDNDVCRKPRIQNRQETLAPVDRPASTPMCKEVRPCGARYSTCLPRQSRSMPAPAAAPTAVVAGTVAASAHSSNSQSFINNESHPTSAPAAAPMTRPFQTPSLRRQLTSRIRAALTLSAPPVVAITSCAALTSKTAP